MASGRLVRSPDTMLSTAYSVNTPEVTPRVGTGVRTTRDGTMMACLSDRVSIETSRAPAKWYRGDPSQDLLQILAYARHRLQVRQVILLDPLAEKDSVPGAGGRVHQLHTGYIQREQLRRALDTCGGFGDISEEAFATLADAFSEERNQREYSERNINYEALCEVLQGKSHHSLAYRQGTRYLDEKYQIMKAQLDNERFTTSFKACFDDAPYARQPLSEAGEARFEKVKSLIVHKIYADRISARELLGDFDPHLNTSVSWMKKGFQRTPMVNMSPGCISRSQYLRGMHLLAHGVKLSEADLNLIFNKYCKNGAFNYLAFCKDVDVGPDGKARGQ
mmetsp:Transcript_17234/g.39741  ORF Transcript_17234/g.39741 Transcript_17234/m.39741 type:complete len:334 (+) Transcript_17234:275-1276(+)